MPPELQAAMDTFLATHSIAFMTLTDPEETDSSTGCDILPAGPCKVRRGTYTTLEGTIHPVAVGLTMYHAMVGET